MNFAKYVILKVGGKEHLVIFDNELQHCQMVPPGTVPVSAGFFIVEKGQLIIPQIGSETLKLDPRPGDKALIAELLQTP